jgi:hypothetical protein
MSVSFSKEQSPEQNIAEVKNKMYHDQLGFKDSVFLKYNLSQTIFFVHSKKETGIDQKKNHRNA